MLKTVFPAIYSYFAINVWTSFVRFVQHTYMYLSLSLYIYIHTCNIICYIVIDNIILSIISHYIRRGHNETLNPDYTQPLLYQKIARPPVLLFCMCLYIYIYIYIYMCVYIYIYIYMYIYIYIYVFVYCLPEDRQAPQSISTFFCFRYFFLLVSFVFYVFIIFSCCMFSFLL